YYEKQNPNDVADTFDSANGWSASDVETPVSKVAKGTTAETEIRATADEGVYDVILHVSTPDGNDGQNNGDDNLESFYQRYTLTYDDGRFWILDKKDLGKA